MTQTNQEQALHPQNDAIIILGAAAQSGSGITDGARVEDVDGQPL